MLPTDEESSISKKNSVKFGSRIEGELNFDPIHKEPVYELSFGKERWWTSEITDNKDDIFKTLNLTTLERVKETHGLKIKYGKQ